MKTIDQWLHLSLSTMRSQVFEAIEVWATKEDYTLMLEFLKRAKLNLDSVVDRLERMKKDGQ